MFCDGATRPRHDGTDHGKTVTCLELCDADRIREPYIVAATDRLTETAELRDEEIFDLDTAS